MAKKFDKPSLAYTVDEAADAIGMSPDFVRKLIRTNELGFKRIGSRILIPVDELKAWWDHLPPGSRE